MEAAEIHTFTLAFYMSMNLRVPAILVFELFYLLEDLLEPMLLLLESPLSWLQLEDRIKAIDNNVKATRLSRENGK